MREAMISRVICRLFLLVASLFGSTEARCHVKPPSSFYGTSPNDAALPTSAEKDAVSLDVFPVGFFAGKSFSTVCLTTDGTVSLGPCGNTAAPRIVALEIAANTIGGNNTVYYRLVNRKNDPLNIERISREYLTLFPSDQQSVINSALIVTLCNSEHVINQMTAVFARTHVFVRFAAKTSVSLQKQLPLAQNRRAVFYNNKQLCPPHIVRSNDGKDVTIWRFNSMSCSEAFPIASRRRRATPDQQCTVPDSEVTFREETFSALIVTNPKTNNVVKSNEKVPANTHLYVKCTDYVAHASNPELWGKVAGLKGPNNVTCLGGKWSTDTFPSCSINWCYINNITAVGANLQSSAYDPCSITQNENLALQYVHEGENCGIVDAECDTGKELRNGTRIFNCTDDGTFDNNYILCEEPCNLADLSPTNQNVIRTTGHIFGGEVLTEKCQDGFVAVGPNRLAVNTIACNKELVRWDGNINYLECTAATCTAPASVSEANSIVIYPSSNESELPLDTTITYICKAGYRGEGLDTIKCLLDGKWTGTFSCKDKHYLRGGASQVLPTLIGTAVVAWLLLPGV